MKRAGANPPIYVAGQIVRKGIVILPAAWSGDESRRHKTATG